MKVLAINGSPHKDGNTFHALEIVGAELEKGGVDYDILQIGNELIHGCTACNGCVRRNDETCVIKTDDLNSWIQMIKNADGLILGSPVYYCGISGTMKSFLDRVFYVGRQNEAIFRHKVGAAVCAVRRTGGSLTFDSLNHYLNYSEMVIATSNYWNVVHGTQPGDVDEDEEGIQILRVLGKNMLWLLKMKEATAGTIQPPAQEKKAYTSFVR